MTPAEWPLRLIPARPPPWWISLGLTIAVVCASMGLRAAFLGLSNGLGLSSTHFPALVVVTLVCGARWGWTALVGLIVLGYASQNPSLVAYSKEALTAMFALSGAAVVMVCGALRATLVKLRSTEAERRLAESELVRHGDRLRLAQEVGGVGVWEWDMTTGDAFWSPAFFRNLGLDENLEAPTAELLLKACHPEDRDWMREVMGKAAATGKPWETEYRVIHPDGSLHWLFARGEGRLDPTGRPLRFVGVNIDITARRLAEQHLRESELRFRALADSAPVLMWVTGADDHREFVNRAYAEFMDPTADYEAALALDWRSRLHPDDQRRVGREEAASEAAKEPVMVVEARFQRAGGDWRWLRAISRLRRDPAGDPIGYIGIGVDITDAKQAEADLTRINELLEERVATALAERDAAQAALMRAQKLEALGQLTGGVAHDFNNLLTVVIGALDMIARHPDDGPRRVRMIEAALGAAQRGERLTQQLLTFARRQPMKTERVEIDALVRESEPLLRRAVGDAVDFAVVTGAEGLRSLVDPVQLEAALMNLSVNARDAVGDRGSIRIETRRCVVDEGELDEAGPGEYVCIVVHDTGEGMDAETLARVFEPFFTTKPVGKGTGLGLSQVYGFARQSAGGVAIDSEPGKGASVRIYLPLSQADVTAEDAPADASQTVTGAALDVLLVEDDEAVAELAGEMLRDLGHRVRHAPHAHEALQTLDGPAKVQLLLTDLIMPGGKNGVELAHEAVALRPGLPVILSSGYSGDTLNTAQATPWPLLRKPYTRDALAACIQRVMADAEGV